MGTLNRLFPLTAELTVGNLRESGFSLAGSGTQSVTDRIRTDLHLAGNPQFLPTGKKLSLTAPFDFHQMFYKADEAQWVVSTTPSLTYRLGSDSQINLNYSFLTHNGFTPFQFDFFPKYNNASLGITLGQRIAGGYAGAYPGYGTTAYGNVGPLTAYGGFPGNTPGLGSLDPRDAGKANLSLNTSYDFESSTGSDLILRAQFQPTTHHYLSLSTGYDWLGKQVFGQRNRLRDIRGRVRVDYGERLQLSLGALWDTNQHTLGRLATILNSRLSSQWQLQALYGKVATGFSSSQPYAQVMLTRNLHCWEASALYRQETVFGRPQRDFRLFMTIKAFPTNTEFGVSRTGQYLTSDLGEIF
jgi:hypothetical protein